MTKITIVAATLFLSMSCSVSTTEKSTQDNQPFGGSCSLVGTWSRCSSSGGSSGKVTLVASENQLHEVIENFNSSPDCQGTPDESFEFDAGYVLKALGQSSFVADGTDADLTPNLDLFGCGANTQAYTVLKFSDDCGQFQPSQTAPSCDPSQRGTSLDPQPFSKE